MSVVIGAGTQYSFYGKCVISANWGYNPNIQRLYCLGDWTPYAQYDKPTQTLSLSVYSNGGAPTYDTIPTQTCADANKLSASVSPAGCDPIDDIDGDWFVTSYGFSKDDASLPGQETWGMQQWVDGQYGNTPGPTYVLRGISEGQGTSTANGDADPGLDFTGDLAESQAGNVSAGAIGRNDILLLGTVTQVGGTGDNSGLTGQGSASMPYTPIWI